MEDVIAVVRTVERGTAEVAVILPVGRGVGVVAVATATQSDLDESLESLGSVVLVELGV